MKQKVEMSMLNANVSCQTYSLMAFKTAVSKPSLSYSHACQDLPSDPHDQMPQLPCRNEQGSFMGAHRKETGLGGDRGDVSRALAREAPTHNHSEEGSRELIAEVGMFCLCRDTRCPARLL